MRFIIPKAVVLTREEQKCYDRIPKVPGMDNWKNGANVMEVLVRSLFGRDAIPVMRRRLFIDPEYAEMKDASPKQIFERHGVEGEDIIRHPNFIPYLRHMIHGPNLPPKTIARLCHILNEDNGSSNDLIDGYCSLAQECVNEFRLPPRKAAREFFRLGIEIGMSQYGARTMREAATKARPRLNSDNLVMSKERPA